MSEWQGASAEAIELLDRTLEGRELERRIMFGLPAYRFQGNMMACAYGEHIVLRVGAEGLQGAQEQWGDEVAFVVRGRRMREYVRLPLEAMADAEQLDDWVDRSSAYVGSLPAKS